MMNLSLETKKLIKEGSLFARLTHEYTSFFSAEKVGFNEEDRDVLVEHCNDPDHTDWFFDRFWKHCYIVNIFFGGAPYSCDREYKIAVNNIDLVSLSRASHYLMDVGCVFHTTLSGQFSHIRYEATLDEHVDEIFNLIDIDSIQPMVIDNVEDAVVSLAVSTNARQSTVFEYLGNNDFEGLIPETVDNLSEVIAYTAGLYNKFIDDVNNGVTYEIPYESGFNPLIIIGLVVSLPFAFVYFSKEDKG